MRSHLGTLRRRPGDPETAAASPGLGRHLTGPTRRSSAWHITSAPTVPTGKETVDEANPHQQASRQTRQPAANASAARRARPRHRSRPSAGPPSRIPDAHPARAAAAASQADPCSQQRAMTGRSPAVLATQAAAPDSRLPRQHQNPQLWFPDRPAQSWPSRTACHARCADPAWPAPSSALSRTGSGAARSLPKAPSRTGEAVRSATQTRNGGHHAPSHRATASRRARQGDDRRRGRRTAGTSGAPHAAVTSLPAHDAARPAARARRGRTSLSKHRRRCRPGRQHPGPSRRQRPEAAR